LSAISTRSDQECLEAWRRDPSAENLRPLIERYGALVYSSAYRRTGGADHASDVTRAVCFVLARRARKLRKKTVLAAWLFQVTAVACRKLKRKPLGAWWRFAWQPRAVPDPGAPLWEQIAPRIDRALERLSSRHRNAVLLSVFLNYDSGTAAKTLSTSERQVRDRAERALEKVSKQLRLSGPTFAANTLRDACAAEGCGTSVPEALEGEILQSIADRRGNRPSSKLARRTLTALAWARWRRRSLIGFPTLALLLALIGGIAWHVSSLSGHSRLISAFLVWRIRYEAMTLRGLTKPARPWPTNDATTQLEASIVRNAHDLYQTTNIWLAHLHFTLRQWQALEAKRIDPMPNFIRPDGMPLLRNPKARRSGLAGVLGYEFDWTHAGFEFGHVAFSNVAVRVKGNLVSFCGPKHSFKVDLNRFVKAQKLGGLDELTLNNLIWDYSYLSDALGYEFFRDAGVPAPRTAYAWLSASVVGQWDRKPLGLYLMVEPVDEAFVTERFGAKKTAVFKPVTYNLFEYLGDDWSAYATIYDVKTKTTPEQQRRVIDLARLVSYAPEPAFTAQIGSFLDLDEFARFLAGLVLLSSYDSILADGQNFYMYLDPHSKKFGFIPWDLDSAWGLFWLGTKAELERASIWHPWVGQNQFIERVMAAEEFRRLYRAHLEDLVARLFVPDRLHRRIDEVAAILHAPVAAESMFRLNKFEQSVGLKAVAPSPGESPYGLNHPAHELKRFIDKRAESVQRQLDGKSRGMILRYPQEDLW
jgi:RNA polymerase sigma factor (sigma-70 family)